MFALVALASGLALWSQRSFGAMDFGETRDLTLDRNNFV